MDQHVLYLQRACLFLASDVTTTGSSHLNPPTVFPSFVLHCFLGSCSNPWSLTHQIHPLTPAAQNGPKLFKLGPDSSNPYTAELLKLPVVMAPGKHPTYQFHHNFHLAQKVRPLSPLHSKRKYSISHFTAVRTSKVTLSLFTKCSGLWTLLCREIQSHHHPHSCIDLQAITLVSVQQLPQ